MKLFDLFEERRNPELNPHMNPIDVLWMHANKPDVYVTFTNIEKVGINPKSHYKFNTPIGIYSYPISYVAEFTEKRTKQGELVVPYRANADWVTIFKQTGRILDSSNYNAGDLANDREKLMDYFDDWFDRNFNDPQTKIKEIFHDHGLSVGFYNLESLFDFYAEEAKVRTPAGIIWAITYFLSNDLAQYFNTHPPIIWTKMFINILDYDAVHDTGYAIIHENEPTQAVHFDRSTLDIIEMMENRVKNKRPGTDTESAPNEIQYGSEGLVVTYNKNNNFYKFFKGTSYEPIMEYFANPDAITVYGNMFDSADIYTDKKMALDNVLKLYDGGLSDEDIGYILIATKSNKEFTDTFENTLNLIKNSDSLRDSLFWIDSLIGYPVVLYTIGVLQPSDIGEIVTTIGDQLEEENLKNSNDIYDLLLDIELNIEQQDYHTLIGKCADLNNEILEII